MSHTYRRNLVSSFLDRAQCTHGTIRFAAELDHLPEPGVTIAVLTNNWTRAPNLLIDPAAVIAARVRPDLRSSDEVRAAEDLLESQFLKPDVYSSYKAPRYWVMFVPWWPNLLTSRESLSLLGSSASDDETRRALDWFLDNQRGDGLWHTDYNAPGSGQSDQITEDRAWITGMRMSRSSRRAWSSWFR